MKKIIFAVIMCFFGMSVQALGNKKEVLQKPTGEYGIGFQDFHWVDQKNCPDIFYEKGKNEKDFSVENRKQFCREIMLRVYYPTNQTTSKNNRSLYYPPVMNAQEKFLKGLKIPALPNKKIETLSQIKSFTIKNATPMEGKNFPVLIFDPGSGVVVQLYENIIGNLVSHGYIVVAVNNTFIGSSIEFPDGRIVRSGLGPNIPILKADSTVLSDILFTRNQVEKLHDQSEPLFSHMDLKKVGLFGHSMGGMSAIKAVRENKNLFQSAVSLDALPVKFGTRIYSPSELAGFQIPFLRLFAAEWRNLAGVNVPKDAKFKLEADNYYVLLSPSEKNTTYTNHMSFSDFSTLQYHPVSEGWAKYEINQCKKDPKQCHVDPKDLNGVGSVDGWQGAELINSYILHFFDHYLKDKPSKNLENCKPISSDTMMSCSEVKQP
jgi:dienelactone hydrolase